MPTHHINSTGNHQPSMEEIRNMAVNHATKAFDPAHDADRNAKQTDKFEFEPMHYISTVRAIRNAVSTSPTTKTRAYIDRFTFEPTHRVNFIAKEI